MGAAVTQLFDVENAAVVSVLIALVGLLPALVTWLVEIGKKWDAPDMGPAGGEAAAELDYSQARALRYARIAKEFPPDLEAVVTITKAFEDRTPPKKTVQGGSGQTEQEVADGVGE